MRHGEYSVRIYDANGRMSSRWFVELTYWDNGKRCRRKYYRGINRIKDRSARRKAAQDIKQSVLDLLQSGYWPTDVAEKKPAGWITALNQVLRDKQHVLREKTLVGYRTALRRFLDYCELQGVPEVVTKSHANAYKLHLQREIKLSNVSRNTYLRQLGALFEAAVEAEYLPGNPFRKLKKLPESPTSNVAFTHYQRGVLKQHLAEHHPHLLLFCSFVYYCYIRPAELCRLRVSNLHWNTQKIFIPAEAAKNRRNAWVHIPGAFWTELQKWTELQSVPGSYYLFGPYYTPSPKQLDSNNVSKHHRAILKQLHIGGGCTLYSWKHTGVVELVKTGVNIKDVQNHLRHQSLEEVAIYLRSLGLEPSSEVKTKFPQL